MDFIGVIASAGVVDFIVWVWVVCLIALVSLILVWLSPLFRLTVGVNYFIVSVASVGLVDFIASIDFDWVFHWFRLTCWAWLIPLFRLAVGVDDFIVSVDSVDLVYFTVSMDFVGVLDFVG